MATSVVYGSIFGAVLASIPAVSTRLMMFDTSVVDLSEELSDPVELLFGIRLGGGTNIDRALAYCQGLGFRPTIIALLIEPDAVACAVEAPGQNFGEDLLESVPAVEHPVPLPRPDRE